MRLFRYFLLFTAALSGLWLIPAGTVLLDAAAHLRQVRVAEGLIDQLHRSSTLLHALHQEQAASLRRVAGVARNELHMARGITDAAIRHDLDSAAALSPVRRQVDAAHADGLEILWAFRAVATAVLEQAEREPAVRAGQLAGAVEAWLALLRTMDYAAQDQELAWLLVSGNVSSDGALVLELCNLRVRQEEQLRQRLARELPPSLASAVAALEHGQPEPVLRRCGLRSGSVDFSGNAVAASRLEALAALETQLVQWLHHQVQQQLLGAWVRGFLTIVTLGAMALLLAVSGYFLMSTYARPLERLRHTVRALQNDPDGAARAATHGRGEVAELAAAFNELVDARQENVQYQRLADSVFEHALDGILVTDAHGTIQAVNPALGQMLGYPGRTLMYRNVRLFRSGRHDAAFYRAMWQAITARGEWCGEIWNRRGDGSLALLRLSIAAVRDAAGVLLHYVGIYTDVTEQHRAEEALRRAHDYQHTIIAALGEGLYCVDGDGMLRFLNPAAERMLGWREEELLGRNAHDAFHDRRTDGTPLPRNDCKLLGAFRDGIAYHGEEVFTRRDGSRFPVECHATPLRENGTLTGAVIAFVDISRRKDDEQRIRHLAYHDSLTGLANRSFMLQHLRLLIAQGQRHPLPLAVLFLDLDRFKHINDSLGHHVGDTLLMQVAARLRGVLREGDLLARQGGDEFIVVCSAERNGDGAAVCPAAMQVARKMHAALADPFVVDGQELYVSASVGISCLPEHGGDADTLLRHADQAMYQAKQAGIDTAVYAPGGDRFVHDRLTLETRLRGALARNDLHLVVQPVVELASGRIVGGEVLLRWLDEGSLIGPELFIPLAEETGQIDAIGAWLNTVACGLAAHWRALAPDFILAVNLSPRQLFGRGLLRSLCRAMTEHGLGHGALELEITETVTMSLPRRARRSIRWLRQRGLRLSIDDFGTGHSSLTRLQEITADRLKIDRSFVRGLPDTPHSVTIVRNTIALAHDLGMTVVAEGVETEGQRQLLLELGCDYAQGFLFSRPVAAEEFTHLLAGDVLEPAQDD